ncbi:MAG: LysM peptidoglycan-binding domain-containing protein, partial [Planctomycetota bacterium]|nr:LysM peptidoglycan-binding domain-containing protein [Planctomycetota bacterium]
MNSRDAGPPDAVDEVDEVAGARVSLLKRALGLLADRPELRYIFAGGLSVLTLVGVFVLKGGGKAARETTEGKAPPVASIPRRGDDTNETPGPKVAETVPAPSGSPESQAKEPSEVASHVSDPAIPLTDEEARAASAKVTPPADEPMQLALNDEPPKPAIPPPVDAKDDGLPPMSPAASAAITPPPAEPKSKEEASKPKLDTPKPSPPPDSKGNHPAESPLDRIKNSLAKAAAARAGQGDPAKSGEKSSSATTPGAAKTNSAAAPAVVAPPDPKKSDLPVIATPDDVKTELKAAPGPTPNPAAKPANDAPSGTPPSPSPPAQVKEPGTSKADDHAPKQPIEPPGKPVEPPATIAPQAVLPAAKPPAADQEAIAPPTDFPDLLPPAPAAANPPIDPKPAADEVKEKPKPPAIAPKPLEKPAPPPSRTEPREQPKSVSRGADEGTKLERSRSVLNDPAPVPSMSDLDGLETPGSGSNTAAKPSVPRPDPVVPRPDPVAPRLDPVAPRPDPVVPRPDPVAPRPADFNLPATGVVKLPRAGPLELGGVSVRDELNHDLDIASNFEGGSRASRAEERFDESVRDQVEPVPHVVRRGETFWSISRLYYGTPRYYKALWSANKDRAPSLEQPLIVGMTVRVPPPESLDAALIEPASTGSRGVAPGRVRKTARPSSRASDDFDDAIPPAESDALKSKPRASTRNSNVALALPKVDEFAAARARERDLDPLYGPEETPKPMHRVGRYETLRGIARDYLGDSRRADEILELNRDAI